MSTSSPTICVVDDDPLVRKTITAILEQDGNTVAVHESGASFLAALDTSKNDSNTATSPPYGCVLLDVKMPDMDGIEVLQRLDGAHRLSVIMISGQGDISTAVQAMRHGAIDFIEKPFTPDQLIAAVDFALAAMANAPPTPLPSPPEIAGLSARELEVLELLVDGDANKVIAFKLGISQRTVEVHRARIMERMNVKTFAELVRKAIASGL